MEERSSRRDRDSKRKTNKGFKWKEKQRDDTDDRDRRDRDTGLQRGYKEHYRPRSRSRSPQSRRHSPRRDDRERDRDHERRRERDRSHDRNRDLDRNQDRSEPPPRKEKKERPKNPAPATPSQPMIIVYVNDRLGTKKAIPCFPTDPIKDFKVIVASMIGRQPHEILLKRQGERPFKDQLTLQDYGVSNNVQLDLEVDTGD
jgi:hypothetical protein